MTWRCRYSWSRSELLGRTGSGAQGKGTAAVMALGRNLHPPYSWATPTSSLTPREVTSRCVTRLGAPQHLVACPAMADTAPRPSLAEELANPFATALLVKPCCTGRHHKSESDRLLILGMQSPARGDFGSADSFHLPICEAHALACIDHCVITVHGHT